MEAAPSGSTGNVAPLRMSPLKGEICTQLTRCGKANCRCNFGQYHGPYHYRVWRDGSRVRKAYVPRDEVERVSQACSAYKTYRKQLSEAHNTRESVSRDIQRAWRGFLRMTK